MNGRGRAARLLQMVPDHARTAVSGLIGHRRPSASGAERLVVQAVIEGDAGVVLAVRQDLRGWELPGGNLRAGEGEERGLLREVEEETGLCVEINGLVGEYRRTGFLPHRARVYRCSASGGSLRPSKETPVVRWFDRDALPQTLFPWHRTPLEDSARTGAPVTRTERLGFAAIWAGFQIDLRMRWTGDEAG